MSTESIGNCQHCGQNLNFPAEISGHTTECPHCHQQTLLYAATPLSVPLEPPKIKIVLLEDEFDKASDNIGTGIVALAACGGLITIVVGLVNKEPQLIYTALIAAPICLSYGLLMRFALRAVAEILRLLRKISEAKPTQASQPDHQS